LPRRSKFALAKRKVTKSREQNKGKTHFSLLFSLLFRVFQDIGSTWNKVFQKFIAFETLCFSPGNKMFLPLKQSVSST